MVEFSLADYADYADFQGCRNPRKLGISVEIRISQIPQHGKCSLSENLRNLRELFQPYSLKNINMNNEKKKQYEQRNKLSKP